MAAAARADLSDEHAKAAALWSELVRDVGEHWDYPERALLLVQLRALRRTADAVALCRDSMRPALFRFGFLALRHECQRN